MLNRSLHIPQRGFGLFVVFALAWVVANAVDGTGAQDSLPSAAAHVDLFGDALPPGALARLGTIRHRYPDARNKQFLRDGHTLLVAEHATVRWIEAGTGRTLKTRFLPAGCWVCGFTRDGDLALVTDEKALFLWDVNSWRQRQKLADTETLQAWRTSSVGTKFGTHEKWAHCRFDRSGSRVSVNLGQLAMAIGTGVWDTGTGRELCRLAEREIPLGFQPDGTTFAVLDVDNSRIRLRAAANGHEQRSFTILSWKEMRGVLCSPDGKSFFAGTGDGCRAWDIPTGRELPRLAGGDYLFDYVMSRDGHTLLTGDRSQTVWVWDWPSGKLRRRIDLGAGKKLEPQIVWPGGRRAEITVADDVAWHSVDLVTGKEIPRPCPAHSGSLLALGLRPDGRAVSACSDGSVRTWDLRSGRQLDLQQADLSGSRYVALRADDLTLASAHENDAYVSDRVSIADLTGRDRWQQLEGRNRYIFGMMFSPAKRVVAICWQEKQVAPPHLSVWDVEQHKEMWRRPARYGAPAFSADGRLVAYAGEDRGVVILDVTSGVEQRLPGTKDEPYFAFSADGRMLAVGDEEGVAFWELSTGSIRRRIAKPAPGHPIVSLAPDGRWLARAAGPDIQLFNAATGAEVSQLTGHSGAVTHLVFTPDSGRLVSGSDDSTALVWDIPSITHQ